MEAAGRNFLGLLNGLKRMLVCLNCHLTVLPKLKNNVMAKYQNDLFTELHAIDEIESYFSPYEFLDQVKVAVAHQNCLLEGNRV